MNIKDQINIFIVDDNKVFLLALKAYIEGSFKEKLIKIYTFETGEKCLESFTEIMPDLVILDNQLNSEITDAASGLEILSKIKIQKPLTSVIMLTSDEHIDVALKSFHHGASDYVVKTASTFNAINLSISKIFADKELYLQSEDKKNQAIESIIASKELLFKTQEKEKRAAELVISNKELEIQKEEKEKRLIELIDAQKELSIQKLEKEKQTIELNIINLQKAEAEKSKQIIEEKNKDITASINYAKRIQQAKLPSREEIYSSLPQCFILFKPKDIVSGDFYYFHKNNDSIFIVAADCTGHGVPGAFMSMIGSEKLDDALAHSSDVSEILKHLNVGIKHSLHQSNSDDSTRDGMDIAICSIAMEDSIVKYAGANRPLWLIRSEETEVEEIKGTKKAIGGLTDDTQHFESHEIILKKGDTFYISTDGFADQFGGESGKKLMTKKFKEILIDIQNKSMKDQEKYLNDYIENWKSGIEQVDDILVIGIRI